MEGCWGMARHIGKPSLGMVAICCTATKCGWKSSREANKANVGGLADGEVLKSRHWTAWDRSGTDLGGLVIFTHSNLLLLDPSPRPRTDKKARLQWARVLTRLRVIVGTVRLVVAMW